MSHTREEIVSLLKEAEVATVATVAGDKMRTRMMHFAVDDNLRIFVATMKGDPKTLQMMHHPSLSLLVYFPAPEFNQSREIEITGTPVFVQDALEREKALQITAKKSPVVKYLMETGNAGLLDCVRIEPREVKLRVFGEIVQGMPPTVVEFPENRAMVNEGKLLLSKVKNWYREIRAPFLTAALVPVLLGTAISFAQTKSLDWGFFVLTLIAGLLIHAGANTINDYFDHKSGNDDINREYVRPFSGGSRLIQLGLLTPMEVLGISLFCFLVSSLLGLYLAWTRGPLILVLGVIGVISAFFYTGRPFYWAKRGMGELLVGLNFGPLMTLGAYYVQTRTFSWLPVLVAIPVGLLIAAVLYINEFPDYTADKAVGKRTLVVRLGRRHAVPLYIAMMVLANLAIIAGVALNVLPLAALLALVLIPLSFRAIQNALVHYQSSHDLAPTNALTITGHLALGLALTIAYVWIGVERGGVGLAGILGLAFLAFVAYMYWNVERHRKAFHGLKGAVAGPANKS
ncbi:MAG: 1,4-dihydroxy-2-naphthoate octaprenyltransferase [Dehalococcoidia bacterium]|nr:1,4-dihydroxy-2-naphthoate octaprenyltransferase [Dehalococcoidia bacterium]